MKDKKPLVYIGVAVLVILGAYFVFGQGDKNAPLSEEELKIVDGEVYRNSEYGVSFDYPKEYEVIEVTEDESGRHSIIIQMKEIKAPKDGEGPTAITLDIFPDPSNTDPLIWVQENNVSNFSLASTDPESTKVDGEEGISYEWDGLYTGRSVVFYHDKYMMLLSGTYLKTSDKIYSDFDRVKDSIKLEE